MSLPLPAAGGVLTIDTDAIAANWLQLKSLLASGTSCAATIKADAYGTGAARTARRLAEAGCETFCVALPAEGIEVRNAVPTARIFILNGLFPGTAELLSANRLIPVLGSMEEIADWAAHCRAAATRHPAAIHVDTGMNRLGLRPDAFAAVMSDAAATRDFEIVLLMTHLACGSEPEHPMNAHQLARFREATAPYAHIPRSMANSAGVLMGRDFHFDMARPGISLYGGKALDTVANTMQPVVKIEGRVMTLRDVPAGETVGYAAARTTTRPTRIAMVSAGYADGMHRRAGSTDAEPGGYGFAAGQRVPLFGRISMDMMAFDVTDLPEGTLDRGSLVEILGPNVAASDLASYAQTIDYEYLTGLGKRYARHYGALTATGTTG
ncbi:alanine racemase [Roseibium aestuarii]|uniref:Alanine racemase n=1 Tax=Roseibium aestuarii TaxID=2600299 RepID=A0ABW4JRX4_9HYPH|nr:alanine racemase [Roseibium aestuarii]